METTKEERHEHQVVVHHVQGDRCATCWEGWPCLPHRLIADIAALEAENGRLRKDMGKLCGVCRLTCEIPHKAVSLMFTEGRLAWFHDAHATDCWERLKRHVVELNMREARAALAPEGDTAAKEKVT